MGVVERQAGDLQLPTVPMSKQNIGKADGMQSAMEHNVQSPGGTCPGPVVSSYTAASAGKRGRQRRMTGMLSEGHAKSRSDCDPQRVLFFSPKCTNC